MESTEVTAEKTSAQMLYEERQAKLEMDKIPFLPQQPLHSEVYDLKAAEFNGEVTGTGIKQVMKEPKTCVHLIPPQFIEGIGDVLQYGANKYAANNWMAGMSWSTVFGGVLRHLFAWFRREEIDKESGLPHLYHATCGIMFLAWYCHGPNNDKHRQVGDDRVFAQ